MTTTEIDQTLRKKKFIRNELEWFGKLGPIILNIEVPKDDNPIKVIFDCSPFLIHEFVPVIQKYQKEAVVGNYYIESEKIIINIFTGTSVALFDSFLESLAKYFLKGNIKNKCSECSNIDKIGLYLYKNTYNIFCNVCAEGKQKELHLLKSKKNKYLIGFFASLIGALLGSVLWVCIGILGYYAVIAGFAIGYFSFIAYKILNPKKTIIGLAGIILSVFLAVFISEFVLLYFQFKQDAPKLTILLYLKNITKMIQSREILKHIVINIIVGFTLALIGSRNILHGFIFDIKYTENTVFKILI